METDNKEKGKSKKFLLVAEIQLMEIKAYTFAFFLFSFSLPQSGTLIEWKPTTRKKVKVESKNFCWLETFS
jgi:hypothetical protein